MEEIKKEFQNNIYKYCDENVGKKILFPAFRHLYPIFRDDSSFLAPKEITTLTNEILNELNAKEILKEVNTPDGFVTGYPMYEILEHNKLRS